ncbi:MAG TPA: TetR family transcriptional regulator [Nocardioidaceae bacterium]|nr:TetR family transcriptional regulator [Nocardioidaceae bacterium]
MSTVTPLNELDPHEAARLTRAQRRSQQLLGAAARLMERDGSHAVSMQAVAEEAGVSVGLIYRYFGGKDDLLLAVIVDVLDEFATRVPEAIEAAGDNPVERLAAAFRAYCEVIDDHRHAAVLTYRESKSLSDEGRARI